MQADCGFELVTQAGVLPSDATIIDVKELTRSEFNVVFDEVNESKECIQKKRASDYFKEQTPTPNAPLPSDQCVICLTRKESTVLRCLVILAMILQ